MECEGRDGDGWSMWDLILMFLLRLKVGLLTKHSFLLGDRETPIDNYFAPVTGDVPRRRRGDVGRKRWS